MASGNYIWMLINDFMDVFNSYFVAKYSPSDQICVDKYISCWYGFGGHWINCGLIIYVDMDSKPEKGCEIQDCCDSKSKLMMQLNLVKISTDVE